MMSKSLFDSSINLVIICSVLLIYFITSSANHWIVCDPFDDAISLLAYSNPTGFVKKGRGILSGHPKGTRPQTPLCATRLYNSNRNAIVLCTVLYYDWAKEPTYTDGSFITD